LLTPVIHESTICAPFVETVISIDLTPSVEPLLTSSSRSAKRALARAACRPDPPLAAAASSYRSDSVGCTTGDSRSGIR